ncbi:MAG: cyclodeaminase/cyclohydrolase family protein, partial [Firmicutes bacterium]|nr:cyclodeaminase/cyclohydrolase family protein [Bacillota bacterium]
MLADLTMKDFMKELASNSPIPGGGSIAAMCGSTGCNLVAMVAALTVGKKGYEEYWDEMAKLKADMEAISDEQLKAIDDDANAYATVVGCFSMPKNTEEEKALRAKTIQEKTEEAAQ